MDWLKQTGAATKIGDQDTGRSRSRRPGAVQLQAAYALRHAYSKCTPAMQVRRKVYLDCQLLLAGMYGTQKQDGQ